MNTNVNWDFWGGLDLWPLDAACKIACGVDPDTPTYWSQILCHEDERPDWADMMIEAGGQIGIGELEADDRAWSFRPDDFRAWVARSQFKKQLPNLSRPKA